MTGPALKRERPEEVPALTLTGLPGYVTSSDEEEEGEEYASETQK